MVNIPIIDDVVVENNEAFNVTLTTIDTDVTLRLQTTSVTIRDNDSKLHCTSIHIYKHNYSSLFIFTSSVFTIVTIGFTNAAYSVYEDAGSVSVTVSVQTGNLDRNVIVTLSTVNGTALCESLKSLYPIGYIVLLTSTSIYSMFSSSHFSSWDRL